MCLDGNFVLNLHECQIWSKHKFSLPEPAKFKSYLLQIYSGYSVASSSAIEWELLILLPRMPWCSFTRFRRIEKMYGKGQAYCLKLWWLAFTYNQFRFWKTHVSHATVWPDWAIFERSLWQMSLQNYPKYWQIWNIFVLSKNCIGYWFLGYIFHISGYFLFQHLVSPPVNQSQSVSFKCRGRQQKQRIFWNSFRHEINQSYLDCG